MPEYEYRCKKCEGSFVVERSMSDNTEPACSECGSQNLSRVWTANFVAGKPGSAKSGAANQGEMCASNPAKPKSCCPCG